MKTSMLAVLAVALAGAAACGDDAQVTAPSPSGTTETFSGTLAVQGSSFYSFSVSTSGTVSISLASLTANGVSQASTSVVRLGLGVPVGTGCSINTSADTTTGLTAQLTSAVNPDVYCVNISDIGNLTVPLNFTIRIGQNISSGSSTPSTETFASFLAVRGSSTRKFTIAQSGTISLTLTSVTPSTTVGIGIGIPDASTPACSLTNSLNTTAGSTPQIALPVDAGTYCATVYDSGSVADPGVSFSMTIAHP
jgi:hypothetical protein